VLTISATPVDVAAHLRLVIARTARRLRQEAGGDLSPSLTAALATVERHGPLTPSELAAHERIQRPTATRLLAALAERGLVARAPDPGDRRSSLVSLTAAGGALLHRQRGQKEALLARRLEGLAPDELVVLARAAAILERVLEEPR
jgi:DNA-binding MarR family transcriptional regulator